MRATAARGLITLLATCLVAAPAAAQPDHFIPLPQRSDALIAQLEPQALRAAASDTVSDSFALPAVRLRIDGCSDYPYHEPRPARAAAAHLLTDLRQGLSQGLACLAGNGPVGRLHPYHEYQAHRLLNLLEGERTKTLRCVADEMFATAVATSPRSMDLDDPLVRQLALVEFPGVVLDTYRLGGLLSRTHDDETFRSFFHLSDQQIYEHRNGRPIRAPSLHRFENRPALLFHELVHWLGHEHSALYPDLTHLYETCCFGGSDYIDEPGVNREYQQTACRILKDDELWSQSYSPYKQLRTWHFKGYDRLKKAMRSDYRR